MMRGPRAAHRRLLTTGAGTPSGSIRSPIGATLTIRPDLRGLCVLGGDAVGSPVEKPIHRPVPDTMIPRSHIPE
jgi:hypothetical protein